MARLVRWALAASLICTPTLAAQIAVDLSGGVVLTESDADASREPASLAKLMTAFVAFEALDAGEISEDTLVTVSSFAARRPPVKLYLKAGSEVAFASLLGAAVVGSKNDAAVAVAEAVAGSEAAFVSRMNAAAERLGMANSRFANATGLPASSEQRTTARDMAILSSALLRQHPERAKLLSHRSVRASGKRITTTNPLFGRVVGAEGLKTGFTCAAGYSIAALVERDGRRVIAVTLGHTNKASRLSTIRGLIDAAFRLPPDGQALSPASSNTVAPKDVKACVGAPANLIATDISPEEKALYEAELAKARRRVEVVSLAVTSPSRPRQIQPKRSPPPLSGWGVFLGASSDTAGAQSQLRAALKRSGSRGFPRIETRQRDGRRLAILYGLDQPTATALCRALQTYCIVLSPARVVNPRAQWRN